VGWPTLSAMASADTAGTVVPRQATLGEAAAAFLVRRELSPGTLRSSAQTMAGLRRELGDAASVGGLTAGAVAAADLCPRTGRGRLSFERLLDLGGDDIQPPLVCGAHAPGPVPAWHT
jgi:hypothetical protein